MSAPCPSAAGPPLVSPAHADDVETPNGSVQEPGKEPTTIRAQEGAGRGGRGFEPPKGLAARWISSRPGSPSPCRHRASWCLSVRLGTCHDRARVPLATDDDRCVSLRIRQKETGGRVRSRAPGWVRPLCVPVLGRGAGARRGVRLDSASKSFTEVHAADRARGRSRCQPSCAARCEAQQREVAADRLAEPLMRLRSSRSWRLWKALVAT